ncbi:hypothetical protein BP6252_09431 [Coleophoma cylindrospora]|uniref:Transcription initiation factor TFIID subunit 12 domain-containing protein n=1 Tax=Coleophoma cylindrospora TaxID=1849047 RepID=A0A3D8R1W4_9HELO|nr:hypothetical protein BP6252_09431 [Coleophoma cylindrospora]
MNGAQGQPGQGQQSGAQPQQGQGQPQQHRVQLYKPENMRTLPEQFSAAEKQKWEQGLRVLWGTVEKNGPETQAHQDAKRKLYEFSKTLTQKIQQFRTQHAARLQQQGGGTAMQGVEAARAQGPKISQKVMDHINSFPYQPPSQYAQGSPEAAKWIQETKSRYLKGLLQMETSKSRMAGLDAALEKRNNEGNPLNADEEKEWREKKESAQKSYNEAQQFVEGFRKQQQAASQASNSAQQQANASAGANTNANPAQPSQAAPNAGAQSNAIQAGAGAQRPQMNLQQQNSIGQTVNAAIEAARNQQMGGGRPQMQAPNGQPSQNPVQGQAQTQGQAPGPTQNQPQAAPSMPNMPQGGPAPHIKTEAGIPAPINTAVAQVAAQQRSTPLQNNSPQSAIPQSAGPQSGTSQGPPRPLTHQAALSQAARSYSSGQTTGTPNVMGMGTHAHPAGPGRETPNTITNKMPIPKHLPPNATAPPQPVSMPQPRPSYSGGPSNVGNGVMGQPVLTKPPGFQLDGDGDRVLNKKKLDELVKQITGGGDILGSGEGLTAETEESILNVADSFVDQVLQSACKNAKERGSNMLEIRDIQLTLERQYNIRIPGYASDEIRTVRKIQPAPNWISKMSAVQAAKVTRKDDV